VSSKWNAALKDDNQTNEELNETERWPKYTLKSFYDTLKREKEVLKLWMLKIYLNLDLGQQYKQLNVS